MIPAELIKQVNLEIGRGTVKWGAVDKDPPALLNAAIEELGEVAHAINHAEREEVIQQEVAETIGILVRLYKMLTAKIKGGKQCQ